MSDIICNHEFNLEMDFSWKSIHLLDYARYYNSSSSSCIIAPINSCQQSIPIEVIFQTCYSAKMLRKVYKFKKKYGKLHSFQEVHFKLKSVQASKLHLYVRQDKIASLYYGIHKMIKNRTASAYASVPKITMQLSLNELLHNRELKKSEKKSKSIYNFEQKTACGIRFTRFFPKNYQITKLPLEQTFIEQSFKNCYSHVLKRIGTL